MALIFALWQTPLVLPLKILVVFFHELSHGLAAILTGGDIVEINVSRQVGGYAITRGGNRFAVLSAGYVGSLVLGAGLLVSALRSVADRVVMAALGAVTLLVTLLYLSDMFTLAFGLLTGLAMLACAKWLSLQVNDMVLRVIGLNSMIYVPYDIFDDTIRRAHLRSDARMLAEEFGGATVIWGAVWLLISLCVIVLTLRVALRQPSNLTFGTKPR
ncbi:MAG: M50 family metallopeptidase [Pseudomonadota bacterium]